MSTPHFETGTDILAVLFGSTKSGNFFRVCGELSSYYYMVELVFIALIV
jgi:hypothetical protein